MTTVKALTSSASNEWFTPVPYLNAVRQVLGEIDLDPASCPEANERVKAATFYTEADDGLTRPWWGTCFLNPPYSRRDGKSNQSLWTQKAIAEYMAGNVSEMIVLVNAQTGDGWFQNLWNFPICFVDGRIHFDQPRGGKKQAPTHGNVFVYFGEWPGRFAEVFGAHGHIVHSEPLAR